MGGAVAIAQSYQRPLDTHAGIRIASSMEE